MTPESAAPLTAEDAGELWQLVKPGRVGLSILAIAAKDHVVVPAAELASLRAQNEGLRAALAEMIRLEDAPMYAGWKQDWLTSVGEARAALAKQGGGS